MFYGKVQNLPGKYGNKMRDNFWKGKKILVTGYEGFLGSHLTKTLVEHGGEVYGLDIITKREDTILQKKDLDKVRIIKGDVKNFSLVSRIIKKNDIEFIFHLAAEALVGECLKNPLTTFSTNIKGTWNILEAARFSKTIKTVIITSSDKAYGYSVNLPYKEDFPLAGCHPYDVSKSCADLLSYTYFRTYNLPVGVIRCGNIFGPGDFNFSRVVPDAIRSALQNKMLIIRSDGKFMRDYIYIKDVVSGYIKLAENIERLKLFGEAFNFGNEKPISVLDLVKTIDRLVNKTPKYKILGQARYEIKHQYLSAEKAGKILGWKPEYTLSQGLEETIKWYREFFCIG